MNFNSQKCWGKKNYQNLKVENAKWSFWASLLFNYFTKVYSMKSKLSNQLLMPSNNGMAVCINHNLTKAGLHSALKACFNIGLDKSILLFYLVFLYLIFYKQDTHAAYSHKNIVLRFCTLNKTVLIYGLIKIAFSYKNV